MPVLAALASLLLTPTLTPASLPPTSLFWAAGFNPAISSRQIGPALTPARPRDIWVFRSVLDNRARMVTCALAKDFWVAYDATNCGLYKTWNGTVNFDGAVYTAVHGPQPTTKGQAYFNGILDKPVWTLLGPDGKELKTKVVFRGYRIIKGQVQFHYELLDGKKTITIHEMPEVITARGVAKGITRTFSVTGLEPGQGLRLIASDSEAKHECKVKTSSNGNIIAKDDGNIVEVKVYPSKKGITTFDIQTTFPARALADVSQDYGLEEVFASIYDGTGHKKPAPPEALKEQGQTPEMRKDDPDSRQPGLSYMAYLINAPLNKIPTLVPNQTPNVNKTVPNVNFLNPKDFGLSDMFYAEVKGFLTIKDPGLYFFRMSSDDGSRLKLRGETVIDNDGLGSGDWKEGSLDLNKGDHAIRIDYFEMTGDEKLILQWKKPGDKEWSLVPTEVLSTQAGVVYVSSPGNKKVMDSLWVPRPGDGIPLNSVHPSYDLTTPRPDNFTPRVGGMDFLPDGRLVICTWDPDGAVYVLDGVQTGDKRKVTVKRIAAGLAEPLGLKVVGKDIYVLQKQELTKLVDNDGDGLIDEFYAVANGWGVTSNFHEFAFGLLYDKGYFYGNLATAINPGGSSTRPQNPDRGRTIKINAKDGSYEFVAAGLRTPNGIGFGYKGGIFITDNQGDWLPSSKLMHLKKGAFYGNRSVDPEGMKNVKDMRPVVWLPQGEIGNSPSQPGPLNDGPYKNQMIHGDVTHGGLKRVFVEEVGGQLQGTVFRFTQGLEAGTNRLVWGPDGAVYIGGIGSTGNWGQEGKERYGLQRLKYNGKSTFEQLAVRPMKNGAEIEFTEPLALGKGETLDEYSVSQWKYVPTETYGGPKVDEEKLKVKSLNINKERTKVFVEFDGIKPDSVVYIKLSSDIVSTTGKDLWSTESWSTVNIVPNRAGRPGPLKTSNLVNGLSDQEKAEGFDLLFNGKDLNALKGFRRNDVPKGWQIIDNSLTYVPGIGGGDIATKAEYGDFELRFEWRVAEGSNSGVMYRSTENRGAPWETGVEYQVLDNAKHPDGKNPLTSAASAYAVIAPSKNVVRVPGSWNKGRIVAKGGKVQHWLNDVLVVEYDSDSQAWKDLVKKTKFAGMPEYSKPKVGKIVFQDHGDLVSYRNIRVKRL